MSLPKNPVLLALDNLNDEQVIEAVNNLHQDLGGIKLGLEFWNGYGALKVKEINEKFNLPLFLDLKFHDIPNTVAKALDYALNVKPFLTTIHAQGGAEMIKAAVNIAKEKEAKTSFKTNILAVTILTSMQENDLIEIGYNGNVQDIVMKLTETAIKNGADGVVCSPREIEIIREKFGKDILIVTPGIRPVGSESNDQKRTLTPKEALEKGCNYMVIGRPILANENPKQALQNILKTL
ncbi:MAG: orotidine-5'-phosphate decarboxylase [Sphingobacteriia bacterium]|nr:orotidine-5'-phosphate decarboxylase [Sphingobacteriia bacterium]